MAFGSKGQFRVLVNGIPFRVDAASYQDAENAVAEQLAADPSVFDARVRQLGLDEADQAAVKVEAEQGREALRGQVRVDSAAGGPLSRLAIGAGRQAVNRWRGVRQFAAELVGDEEAARAIGKIDEDERDIYRQLDAQGIGMEDLGEIGTDISAFMIPGLTGVAPMVAMGALLGASSVKGEDDPGRLMDIGLGAAGGAAGPILHGAGKALSGVGNVIRGVSVRIADGVWMRSNGAQQILRALGLASKPGATQNIVTEAVQMAEPGMSRARQLIGRKALDTVQQIIRSLPQAAAAGLRNEADFGFLRAAVQRATQVTPEGINVFNPAVFEQAAGQLVGRYGSMFTKSQHSRLAAMVGRVARAMQNLPGTVSSQTAERILAAAQYDDALLIALENAATPSVRQQLFDALAQRGAQILEAGHLSVSAQATAGAGANVLTEGKQDMEEWVERALQRHDPNYVAPVEPGQFR